jgi:thymidylate kinase
LKLANSIINIALEGPDLAGKSTIFKSIWSKLQESKSYRLFLSDRGPLSILCYGKFYERYNKSELEQLEADVLNFLHYNIVVYVKTSDEVLIERFKNRGDELRQLDDILKIKSVYELYADVFKMHPNFLILNCNNIDGVVDLLSKRLSLGTLKDKIDDITEIVKFFGTKRADTKEIINYRLEYQVSIWDFLSMKIDCDILKSYHNFKELEYDSYELLYAKFKRKIEAELSGYYGKKEDIYSRRFVFVDEECLSYFHIMLKGGNLFVKVNFRSSNISLLKYDIFSIVKMIKIFIQKTKTQLVVDSIKLVIDFDSIHEINET